MSDEAQYYSPIIQAMMHSATLAQQERERQGNQANQAAELKIRQQMADQAQKSLDYMHEHNVAQEQLETQKQALTKEQEHLRNKLDIGMALRQGVINPQAFQNQGAQQSNGQPVPGIMGQFDANGQPASPSGMVSLPGGENVPTASFSNPAEAEAQRVREAAGVAGAQKGAELSAAEPFAVSADERKRKAEQEKLVQEQASNMDQLRQRGADELQVAKIHGGYQQSVANIEGGYKMREIQLMHQLGAGDPAQTSTIANNLIDSIDNGQRAYSSLSADEKRVVDPIAASRGWTLPSNQAAHAKNLDQISSLDKLLDQYRDVINKYSRDSPTSGQDKGSRVTQGISTATGGMWAPTVPGSDLHAAMEGIASTAGKLTKTFEDQARTSDANIVRQIQGTFDPHNTMEQNMKNLNQKGDLLNGIASRTFAGMPPEQVNKILGDNKIKNLGGLQPPQQGTTITVTRDANGKFIPIGQQ